MLTGHDVTYDAWLADRLCRACYRVGAADVLDNAAELHARLVEQTPSFAWARLPTDAIQEVHALTRMGFRLVDTTITLQREGQPPAQQGDEYVCRPARTADETEIASLAARAFQFSRFHLDPQITVEEACRIKEAWVRNFFRGERGDAMFVAHDEKHVIGFLLAIRDEDTLTVDLVAVDDRQRGRGVARALTRAAGEAFPEVEHLRIGTQATNTQAIRCYERMGFLTQRSEYVLHFHHWM